MPATVPNPHSFRNPNSAFRNREWLKNDLATCGVDVGGLKLSDLPNRLGELLDVQLEVQKKTNGEYSNVYLNRRIEIDVPPEFGAGRGAHSGADDVLPF